MARYPTTFGPTLDLARVLIATEDDDAPRRTAHHDNAARLLAFETGVTAA